MRLSTGFAATLPQRLSKTPLRMRRCRPKAASLEASDGADSGRAIRPGEDAEQVGQFVAHFATIDDQIDRAVVEQKLGTLEAFRQGLAHGLLDHPRTGETDQRLRL